MDIIDYIKGSSVKMLLYADDVKIYNVVIKDTSRIELQRVIDNLSDLSRRNKLILNQEKTHVIFYKKKIFYQSYDYIDSTQIVTLSIYKDLGVVFDSTLSFKTHIQLINTKAKLIIICTPWVRGFVKNSIPQNLL